MPSLGPSGDDPSRNNAYPAPGEEAAGPIQLFGVKRKIPNLKNLRLDRQDVYCQCVIVPSDEKSVIVLQVVEALKQLPVVSLLAALRRRVFEGVPELIAQAPDLFRVEIGECC
jgi:hypothetical protein